MIERAAVLIDGGYLNKVLDNVFHSQRIDYEKFSDLICGDCQRLRTYYYNCMPYQSSPPTDEERYKYSQMSKFIHRLEQLSRIQPRMGRLQKYSNQFGEEEFKQKGVDVLLAVELARLSWSKSIGTAILVAGDSDFVPAVETAKDAGVLVKLYYSDISVHDELLTTVDDKILITQSLIDQVILH